MEQKKRKKKWPIVVGIILAIICIAYLGMAMFLSAKFMPGTIINGVDCFAKSLEEVEAELKTSVEEYKLQIETIDGTVEEKTAGDFELTFKDAPEVKTILEKQNSFAWITGLFRKQVEEVEININVDEKVISKVVSSLECMKKENQKAPVSATVAYENGTFVIVDEVYGTQLDKEAVNKVVLECVNNKEQTVNLDEKGCYVQPKYKKDSKEVLAALDELNKYIDTKITYSADSKEVVLDKEEISQWVSVDENMVPVIAKDKINTFVASLSGTFDTPNGPQTLTTPTGKKVNIENAKKGRIVDSDAEAAQLMEDIKGGVTVTRSPISSQEPTPEGQYAWGNTYIEVDLSAQHMWYIKNGSVVFESDVVTGKPSSSTPTGLYRILEKKRDKVLRGEKQPDGSWGYESPVSYWMRVTWSGIGFHDATWQSAFGGTRYVDGYGSHGCINMPLEKAKTLYNTISVETRVIIHK